MAALPNFPASSGNNLKKIGLVALSLVVIATGIFYFNDSIRAEKPIRSAVDASFRAYVAAYTAGVVPKTSTFKIQLTEEYADSTRTGSEVSEKLFKFSPALEGKTTWIDDRTLEFQPADWLESGQRYELTFQLGKLLDVPDNMAELSYEFRTIDQNFEVELDGLKAPDPSKIESQVLGGMLVTADAVLAENVEKMLTATQEGRELTVEWEHQDGDLSHRFLVKGINRKEAASEVVLAWNGSPIEVNLENKQPLEVPSLSDFKLMSHKVVQHPSQYVQLKFSDPLDPQQNLNGLIQISGLNSLRFQVNDNEVWVYPSVRQTGERTVTVNPGIRNMRGYKIQGATNLEATFEQVKPAVRMVGKGTILPSSEGLVMPFEAVSLQAVDVTVIRIYERNIAQFLQINNLDGNRELVRVGRPVVRKTIPLTATGLTDLSKWNRFTLDLSELITAEPGAIYQVKIGFRQEHSVYFCEGQAVPTASNLTELSDDDNWDSYDESSYWDDYEYYYSPNFDWQERDNPCSESYYGSRRTVSKNILASDLGIIAKGGNDGYMVAAVTDLKTLEPLQGVAVKVYNYQQQLLQTVTTGANGIAAINLSMKPFLLVAETNNQKGYLKLDDGNALSLSNFNTGGQKIQKGLKGFLYGERGVWRPGDSLYVCFILEELKALPENHPVIFELVNPMGQVTEKIVRTGGLKGFYNFSTKTAPDAPTGNWMARVQVGGTTFNKPLKIETVKPNRLKINLDFGTDMIRSGDSNLSGELDVKWLHGAIAGNLRAEFEVGFRERNTEFEDFPNYTFDDRSKSFYNENQVIFRGRLNSDGQATINTTIDVDEEAPGMLTAIFTGRVYEESGNFSIDQFSMPYSPYSSYVGIQTPKGDAARGMLLTDTTHRIDIVVVDAEGETVGRDRLELELYKLNWKWWWDQSYDNISNYIGRYGNEPIQRDVVNASGGKASWDFRIDYPEWGRYYVRACDPVSGHCAGKEIYVDWPGWAGSARKEMPGGATMLTFTTDKEKYTVGEEVTLSIPGSARGKAWITLETGSRVIDTYWIDTNKGQNTFSFEARADMAPNIYAYVTLLQPHMQTTNDLPIRMYGVSAIMVEDPDTRLAPTIEMPKSIEPEQQVSVKVSEAEGKPMSYTLAVVDEGLLDLTRFQTPSPWDHFYAREALGVKTWDLYDDVMGAFGGKLERLLAIGGDEAGALEKNAKANRFKPVVIHMGPFFLEKGETNEHTFKMPQYIGSVRTMVVAGYEGAYGSAEQATPVRQPLMVLGTLPRVAGPEETIDVPVNVFTLDDAIKDVQVTIRTNDLFGIDGSATQTLSFREQGEKMVPFRLVTKPALGVGKVSIEATSGNRRAVHEIEIQVRNPNPPTTEVRDAIVEAGKSLNLNFTPFGMRGTNSAILEVSQIPPINLGQRLKYLLNYPHGCIEQTISSSFPQLYLAEVMEMTEKLTQDSEKNIKAAISRLQTFQNKDGGFSYWPGQLTSNEWGSNYALHFLLEAEKKGYNVPGSLLNKAKRFQRKLAREWKAIGNDETRSDLVQAYRLYTLALAGSPETGAMNRMREIGGLSSQAKWRLAASYFLAGQKEAGIDLVNTANTDIDNYREMGYTYGSGLRDKAMILETITLMEDRTKGVALLKEISEALSDQDYWMSTQTTAYCLIAATKFNMTSQDDGGEMAFSYQVNGGQAIEATTGLPLVQNSLAIDQNTGNALSLTNTSKKTLFVRLIMEGTPARGNESAAASNLQMEVKYTDKEGQQIDPTSLEQATDIYAEVAVFNPGIRGDYEELALTQIFPSGWEIFNTRLFDTGGGPESDRPEYQDIRDDRVYTYFDLKAGQRKVFRLMLNASYSGEFYLPAINCEAMYDRSVYAQVPGRTVTVTRNDNQ